MDLGAWWMTTAAQWVAGAWTRGVGFLAEGSSAPAILVDASLKSTMLLATAATAVCAFRKGSASGKHFVWALAVMASLILPALALSLPNVRVEMATALAPSSSVSSPAHGTSQSQDEAARALVVPSWEATGFPSPRREAVALTRSPRTASASSLAKRQDLAAELNGGDDGARRQGAHARVWTSSLAAGAMDAGAKPPPVGYRPSFALMAALAWAAGALLLLARLGYGTSKVRALARRSTPVTDVRLEWSSVLRRRMGIARQVTLLESDEPVLPMTWGVLRPKILLPANSAHWSEERLKLVLLHELAHVRRLDALTQLLAQLACAAYWFNPLMWFAARRMRSLRELACDDEVLTTGQRASDYAGELLDMVKSLRQQSSMALATLPMAQKSELEERLRAILSPHATRSGLRRRGVVGAAVLTASLVVPLAMVRPAVAQTAQPKQEQKAVPAVSEERAQKPTPSDSSAAPAAAQTPEPLLLAAREWTITVGNDGRLSLPSEAKGRFEVIDPQGRVVREIVKGAGPVVISLERPGVYTVRSGKGSGKALSAPSSTEPAGVAQAPLPALPPAPPVPPAATLPPPTDDAFESQPPRFSAHKRMIVEIKQDERDATDAIARASRMPEEERKLEELTDVAQEYRLAAESTRRAYLNVVATLRQDEAKAEALKALLVGAIITSDTGAKVLAIAESMRDDDGRSEVLEQMHKIKESELVRGPLAEAYLNVAQKIRDEDTRADALRTLLHPRPVPTAAVLRALGMLGTMKDEDHRLEVIQEVTDHQFIDDKVEEAVRSLANGLEDREERKEVLRELEEAKREGAARILSRGEAFEAFNVQVNLGKEVWEQEVARIAQRHARDTAKESAKDIRRAVLDGLRFERQALREAARQLRSEVKALKDRMREKAEELRRAGQPVDAEEFSDFELEFESP